MGKEVEDLSGQYSSFANKLIKSLLTKDPKKRPTISQILKLPKIFEIVILLEKQTYQTL